MRFSLLDAARNLAWSRVGNRSLVRVSLVLTLVITLVGTSTSVIAQSPPAGGGLGGQLGGDVGQPGVAPGGAAMADFDTLMNLIQQTIDPDSWLANGGTNTILPYPAGVFVDPAGHLRRVEPAEQLDRTLLAGASNPAAAWRNASGLRTVSLKKLDQALTRSLRSGLNPGIELQKLAGLKKITYVSIDVAEEDVLIAGPAGDTVFGFELQDVAVVSALINGQTTPLGCSIEPTNAGLLAVQDFVQSSSTVKALSRNPRRVVEQMQDKIGNHEVHVFGLAPNTGTAVALIDADEHMKKVGFGMAATPVRIDSYFDHLDRQTSVPKQSLIRWWFAYADEAVKANQSRDLFELPQQCVAVLSEQQWVSQQGRAPTGGQDPAADAFASGMTQQLPALRESHASYARLSAVFELGLALQLVVESTGQNDLKAWLPTLCSLGAEAPAGNSVPRSVSGLTTWHKLTNGTVVAVVSGGVKIDANRLADSQNWQASKFLSGSLVPSAPEIANSAHGSWWWDTK